MPTVPRPGSVLGGAGGGDKRLLRPRLSRHSVPHELSALRKRADDVVGHLYGSFICARFWLFLVIVKAVIVIEHAALLRPVNCVLCLALCVAGQLGHFGDNSIPESYDDV